MMCEAAAKRAMARHGGARRQCVIADTWTHPLLKLQCVRMLAASHAAVYRRRVTDDSAPEQLARKRALYIFVWARFARKRSSLQTYGTQRSSSRRSTEY
jgi:hypothetical protein